MAQIRQDLGVDEVSARCRQRVDIDTLSVDIDTLSVEKENVHVLFWIVDTPSTPCRHPADTLSIDTITYCHNNNKHFFSYCRHFQEKKRILYLKYIFCI